MNRRLVTIGIVIIMMIAAGVTAVLANGRSDIDRLRSATASYHSTVAAEKAGYGLVPDLDHCFNNPGVGAMGFHYINTDLLDTNVELLKPEAMVYTPEPNGQLKLGAVEYIVPAEPWDAENSDLPSLHGHTFHLNEALGVYVLHVWLYQDNPAGMFEDWNPEVSCP